MEVIDSCAWIEHFMQTPNAKHFEQVLSEDSQIVIPTVVIYEVAKYLQRKFGKEVMFDILQGMLDSQVVELSVSDAIAASSATVDHGLRACDALIYGSARTRAATLWTQDADFEGLENVKYFPKER